MPTIASEGSYYNTVTLIRQMDHMHDQRHVPQGGNGPLRQVTINYHAKLNLAMYSNRTHCNYRVIVSDHFVQTL